MVCALARAPGFRSCNLCFRSGTHGSIYQDKGYYETKVSHDLDVDTKEGLVTAKIQISEGEPIRVAQLSVDIVDAPELKSELDALLPKLPLREGNIFAVDAYQQSESR